MPLTSLQSDVLGLLAAHRNPESYVAGSTPLNRNAPRFSGDIDVFHDREERVARAAELDSRLLSEKGYGVTWLRREPLIFTALVELGGAATKLEWVVDSDFRFFPTLPDPTFGYVLHPVDLATNKAAAAYGRREPRDIVDLLTIHDQILPLGAVIWAVVGKSVGFTPEGVINEIRRTARYTEADFRRIASDPPVDPQATMARLHDLLSAAEAFAERMPTELAGLIFLEHGRPVQPDPARLRDYQTHAGQRRGQWPTSSEISSSMLERYTSPRPPGGIISQ